MLTETYFFGLLILWHAWDDRPEQQRRKGFPPSKDLRTENIVIDFDNDTSGSLVMWVRPGPHPSIAINLDLSSIIGYHSLLLSQVLA